MQKAHAPWLRPSHRERSAEALCLLLGTGWCLFRQTIVSAVFEGCCEEAWKEISHVNMVWILQKGWDGSEGAERGAAGMKGGGLHVRKLGKDKNKLNSDETAGNSTQEKSGHCLCSHTASAASSTLVTWHETMLLHREHDARCCLTPMKASDASSFPRVNRSNKFGLTLKMSISLSLAKEISPKIDPSP